MAGSDAFTTLIMKGLVYLLLLNTISPVLAVPVENESPIVAREQTLRKRDYPVLAGHPTSCNAWTVIRRTDTCASIIQVAKMYQIVLTQTTFLKYNPGLKNNCANVKKSTSVWACIRTQDPPKPTKKTTTTTTKKTTTTTPKKTTTTTTSKKTTTTTTTPKKTTTTTTSPKPPATTTTTKPSTTTTTAEPSTTTTTTSSAKTTSTTTEDDVDDTKTTTSSAKTTTTITTTSSDTEVDVETTRPSNSTTTNATGGGPSVKTTTTTLSTTSEDLDGNSPGTTTSQTTTTTPKVTTTTSADGDDESSTTTTTSQATTTTTTSKATTTTTSEKESTTTTTTTSAKPTPTGYEFAITGAQNGCANRQDINTLEAKDPDVFNLLLVAMNKLHTAGETDPWSYYQLSGIHGIPFVAWPDPKAASPGNGESFDRTRGYCPHGSLLFATWHRPYMLVLEQALVAAGEEIAEKYKTEALKTKYQAAAKRLRFPYWDWSTRQFESHTPDIVKKEKVTVITPDGQKTIDNPFHSYIFKDQENQTFKKPFIGAKRTTRGTSKFTGVSDEAAADKAMQAGFITRRQQTFNNLMSTSSFNDFSSALEVLHNQVHVEIGGEGGGAMYYLAYSAFDPIFWLHHNNIDRLMAIWQAANPDLKLASGRGVGTFQRRVTAGVTQDDENTPLYPFKHPNGEWWTSKDVEDVSAIWSYGYGFPEVPCDKKDVSQEDLDTFSTEQINLLYKPEALVQKRAETESRSEWNVNIIVDQAEMSETFSIYVFLGKPPSDSAEWIKADNKIGTLSVLGNPDMKRVSNLQTAIIPINAILKAKGVEGTEEEINEYLKKNLAWTAMSNGEEIDVNKFKTLKVGVTVNTITVSTDVSVKAEFSDPVLVTAITEEKKAGVSTVEELAEPVDKSGKTVAAVERFAAIVVGETSDAADNAAKIEPHPSGTESKSDSTTTKDSSPSSKTQPNSTQTTASGSVTFSTSIKASTTTSPKATTTTTAKAPPTPAAKDDGGKAGDDDEDEGGYGGYRRKRALKYFF
ncbi:hypothetical protein TWF970_008782 [Orbilia oligospora]|uniref:tyrosinase n=1 Tax=Orbilia oligospora TaxID=2813651 RepID=A0A7C8RJM1_ORBOL|nr:hypothetical protein TWF970_008782 [Orbilia oligospora]